MLVEREGQRRALVENFDPVGRHLDRTGRDGRVDIAFWSWPYFAGYRDAPFGAQVVHQVVLADDDLHDAGRVPQVDEGHSPVVPAAGNPTGQGDRVTGLFGAQAARVMGPDHCSAPRSGVTGWGRRSRSGGRHWLASASDCAP